MPTILVDIFVIVALLYLVVAVLIVSGNNREFPRRHHTPTVSVVVAARNEQDSILNCLQFLAEQDYPEDRIEYIIIDDRSDDATGEIINTFIESKNNFKLITIEEPPEGLTGKQIAMKTGIENSTGEIILSTDADCEVPPGWVSSMVSHFDTQTGMAAGFSAPPFEGAFSVVQAMDHLFLISVASGFAGLGIPQSCIGNNIAFTRRAYEEIGGYDGVGYTVTEDVGLLRRIAEKTSFKVIFNRHGKSLIKTRAAKDIRELTQQRMRWLIGGQKAGGVMLSILILTILIILFSAVSIILWPFVGMSKLTCVSLAIFTGSNLSIMLSNRHFLGTGKILKWFIPHQVFFILYSLYFSMLFLSGKRSVNWKGRIYGK